LNSVPAAATRSELEAIGRVINDVGIFFSSLSLLISFKLDYLKASIKFNTIQKTSKIAKIKRINSTPTALTKSAIN